jgi:hypothetical protein
MNCGMVRRRLDNVASGFSRTVVVGLLLVAVTAFIAADSVEQTSQGSRPALAVLASFDGLGVGMAAGAGTSTLRAPRNPSDNSLAVGPDHVFQIVNSQLAIVTKQGQTFYGPVSTNTIPRRRRWPVPRGFPWRPIATCAVAS